MTGKKGPVGVLKNREQSARGRLKSALCPEGGEGCWFDHATPNQFFMCLSIFSEDLFLSFIFDGHTS